MKKLLETVCGLLSGTALFAIMALTFFDVGGRKLLSHSITGSLELTELMMVVVIFGALPLVSWRGEHVVFDSFDALVPGWLHRIQQRVVHLFCAIAFVVMARLMVMRADRFSEYGDITVHLQLPMAPVAWLMAAFLIVTALVHLLFVFVPAPEPAFHGALNDQADA